MAPDSPRAVGSTRIHEVRVDILCPLDLDFEPDVERLAAEDVTVARVQPGPGGAPAVEMPRTSLGRVSLDGETLAAEAKLATRVYRFGTAIVRVSFQRDEWTLADLAKISAQTEQLEIDGKPVLAIAAEVGREIRAKLAPYALARYAIFLETSEAYPVVRVGALDPAGPTGDVFIEAERRILTAITGIPGRVPSRLSSFALETAPLRNLGPLEEDVVVIREAGALIHVASGARGGKLASDDAKRIAGLIELAYAQYWSLRSVDELTMKLQQEAYDFISRLQEHGRANLFPGVSEVLSRLYRAREEHMAITALVDDFLELPAIGNDVYLDAVFVEIQKVFDIVERSKLAQERLEDLERSFEVSHQITAERRLFTLEVLVLLVIVLELVLPFVVSH